MGRDRGEAPVRGRRGARRREDDGDSDEREQRQLPAHPNRNSMGVDERTRIDLPSHIPGEFEVFVSGIRQARGVDYEVEGRTLLFPRPIEQEGRLGFWRWLLIWLGVVGSYKKNELVDVVYTADGRREVETGLKPS